MNSEFNNIRKGFSGYAMSFDSLYRWISAGEVIDDAACRTHRSD